MGDNTYPKWSFSVLVGAREAVVFHSEEGLGAPGHEGSDEEFVVRLVDPPGSTLTPEAFMEIANTTPISELPPDTSVTCVAHASASDHDPTGYVVRGGKLRAGWYNTPELWLARIAWRQG
jgi:hypothetical protein